jgi:hypothetical protein
MSIDWVKLEDRLYSLCVEEIERFAQAHADETFYGFALDCNSDYGEVFLCLNTPEDLHQRAVHYSTAPLSPGWEEIGRRMAERFGIPYEPPPLKSVEENEDRLRWSLGDWKYHAFNSDQWHTEWEPFQEAVTDASMDEDDDDSSSSELQTQFMRAACRVLLRLESAGVFEALQRTDDFKTWVADHDESHEDSWERLASVRRE